MSKNTVCRATSATLWLLTGMLNRPSPLLREAFLKRDLLTPTLCAGGWFAKTQNFFPQANFRPIPLRKIVSLKIWLRKTICFRRSEMARHTTLHGHMTHSVKNLIFKELLEWHVYLTISPPVPIQCFNFGGNTGRKFHVDDRPFSVVTPPLCKNYFTNLT